MQPFHVIAIPTAVAETVRSTMVSPQYGHPAHAEVARGYGPCRLCLRTFQVGVERRILFTHDPFAETDPYPLPEPVYIHEAACERYREDAGFPDGLRAHPLTLDAYATGRRLVSQERVEDGRVEPVLERLLALPDVAYVHVRDTRAGCFDLRVERGQDVPAPVELAAVAAGGR